MDLVEEFRWEHYALGNDVKASVVRDWNKLKIKTWAEEMLSASAIGKRQLPAAVTFSRPFTFIFNKRTAAVAFQLYDCVAQLTSLPFMIVRELFFRLFIWLPTRNSESNSHVAYHSTTAFLCQLSRQPNKYALASGKLAQSFEIVFVNSLEFN